MAVSTPAEEQETKASKRIANVTICSQFRNYNQKIKHFAISHIAGVATLCVKD
jgi:hypothetical protein